MEAEVTIHDSFLIALDVLREHERAAVEAAIRELRAGVNSSDPRIEPVARDGRGELFRFDISPEFLLHVRRVPGNLVRYEVLAVVNKELLASLRSSLAA